MHRTQAVQQQFAYLLVVQHNIWKPEFVGGNAQNVEIVEVRRIPRHPHVHPFLQHMTLDMYRVTQKIGTVLYALTLPNINRFSTLFHCQNQEKICNNTITKDPTTPQVCRYTTLWNVKCMSQRSIGQWRRRLECVVQQQGRRIERFFDVKIAGRDNYFGQ